MTSMTNFISNFSTSKVLSTGLVGARVNSSRMPLNNAPEESSGGPKATSGGLSILIFKVSASLPGPVGDGFGDFGAMRSFLYGF